MATLIAKNAEEATDIATAEHPDIIFLPDEIQGVSGIGVGAALRARPGLGAVPMVLLSEDRSRETRISAVNAGFDAVLTRQPEQNLLRAWVRNLMRRLAAQHELGRAASPASMLGFAEASDMFTRPSQIALIARSSEEGLAWRNQLGTRLRDQIAVLDPKNAFQDLERAPWPDAIVVAPSEHDPSQAQDLISDLRSRSETFRSAVILVQEKPDDARTIMALDLGVNDVVDDGFDGAEMAGLLRRELARKTKDDNRRAAIEDGLRLATIDPLTGLYNRRCALGQLQQVIDQSRQAHQEFAVMVLDLDRFKSINDAHGHAAGDAVLVEVVIRMQRQLRQGDFMARIGGEEFLAVVRDCDLASARVAAERLRHSVAEGPVLLADGTQAVNVTVSIGMVVSSPTDQAATPAELIDLADRGLYAAKAEGRNQVTVYQSAA